MSTVNKETREVRFTGKLELRADGVLPVVEGYAAVFNSPTELGWYTECILPGAFKRALGEGQDVRLLLNHEDLPLARTKSGTLELTEDAHGLKFRAELDPSDPDVQRLLPKMRRQDLSQCSFAFATVSDKWSTRDGKDYRELIDTDLYDVSIVTYPAYLDTSVALRSKDKAIPPAPPTTPPTISLDVLRAQLNLLEL